MPKLSIVVVVPPHAEHLHDFVKVAGSGRGTDATELLLVDSAPSDGTAAALDTSQRQYVRPVRRLRRPGAAPGLAAACNDGLAAAVGEWVTFVDASRPLAAADLRRLQHALRHRQAPSAALVCLHAESDRSVSVGRGTLQASVDALALAPAGLGACFPRRRLIESGLRLDDGCRADFAVTALVASYLVIAGGAASVVWPAGAAAMPSAIGPDAAAWALPGTYGRALVAGHLRLLDEARHAHGRIPAWLQRTLLLDLARYFTTDLQARAPTAVVSEPLASDFHDTVRRIVGRMDAAVVAGLDPARVGLQVRQALLSYLPSPPARSGVAVTACDREQELLRLSYHVRGELPDETFLLDGRPVAPAYAKRRSCRYFRRTLCHERIVWLPMGDARMLEVRLDGERTALSIDTQRALPTSGTGAAQTATDLPLDAVHAAFSPAWTPPPLARTGWAGLKARALRWLSQQASVRQRYDGAWVFADRGAEADDNAEHLYRWTVRHRPEINAWFLLDRTSPDWPRLSAEGFRLVAPGLGRKLLMLNTEHLISSQPAYTSAGFDQKLYAGALPWRFTFLQHGVIKDDMSHWLSDQPFDIFVTSSPAEHASIAGDDTPYTYTDRETRRIGLPRHDRLLELARQLPVEDIDTILLMPTWRGKLVAQGDEPGTDPVAFRAAFRASEYATSWRALLGSDALRRVAERRGKRLVFMPHPGSAPFLDAFDAPAHIEVVTKAATSIQPLFCRSAAMVTDFSSVAFEMAYLRRPVVYFQFDRDRFFAGDHNWREGYFDYDRDGFGPVAMTPDEVARQLDLLLAPDAPALGEYLARMERALPDRDGGACQRAFEAVRGIRQRHGVAAAGLSGDGATGSREIAAARDTAGKTTFAATTAPVRR